MCMKKGTKPLVIIFICVHLLCYNSITISRHPYNSMSLSQCTAVFFGVLSAVVAALVSLRRQSGGTGGRATLRHAHGARPPRRRGAADNHHPCGSVFVIFFSSCWYLFLIERVLVVYHLQTLQPQSRRPRREGPPREKAAHSGTRGAAPSGEPYGAPTLHRSSSPHRSGKIAA